LPWPISYEGVQAIGEDEGCKLAAYLCPAGKWTCGWGETEGVTPSTRWTQEYADQRFCDSLTTRAAAVRAACTVEPTPNQLAALVSFAYNYGGWKTSTALKAHNRGDYLAAANGLQLVDKFTNPRTGQLEVSPGLRGRRAREAALYLKPSEGAHDMPQAVADQPAVVASPTVQAGATTAGAGALALVSDLHEKLGPVGEALQWAKGLLADLGIPADAVLPALVLGLGAVVVWRRYGQRQDGIA
jgi:lysozyme